MSAAKIKVSPMEALVTEDSISIPKPGDVIEGTIIYVASNYALIDLGPLGTGTVLGKEMKSGISGGIKLRDGDIVSATLITLENEDGEIELSIRAASHEKSWEDLEEKRDRKESVETKVLDANKGGLMAEVNGVTGFLPVSQLAGEHYPRVEDGDKQKILDLLRKLIGTTLTVRILDADRESEKLILSEKAAQSEHDRELVNRLAVGDVVEGEVSGVVDFGAFVKFDAPISPEGKKSGKKLEGLVHISELAWQLIDDPRAIIKSGDHVRAKVIGVEDTRISLSIKALKNDPWENVLDKYHVNDVVSGKIDKMNHFGAFVYLDQDIHGLAHVSEFQDVYPNRKMEEIFTIGETYQWEILSIEPKTHRMGLLPAKDGAKKKAGKKTAAAEPETAAPTEAA